MQVRRRNAVGLLAVLVLTAGCGGAVEGNPVAQAAPSSAPEKMASTSSSARPVITIELQDDESVTGRVADRDATVKRLSDAWLDVRTMSGRSPFLIFGAFQDCETLQVFRDSEPIAIKNDCAVVRKGAELALTMIAIGDEVYVGGSGIHQLAEVPDGIEWIKVDRKTTDPDLSDFKVRVSDQPRQDIATTVLVHQATAVLEAAPGGTIPSEDVVLVFGGAARDKRTGEQTGDDAWELGVAISIQFDESGRMSGMYSRAGSSESVSTFGYDDSIVIEPPPADDVVVR